MTVWLEENPDAFAELEGTLQSRFPTLHAFIEEGQCRIRGTYPVLEGTRELDRYQIEVALPDDYPRSMARVWETAGRIPRTTDRHTFTDGALCLGTPIALWIELQGRFTVERILDMPVRSFLIGNALVEEGQPWPHGERSHGAAGILEHFGELIGTSDDWTVAKLLLDLVNEKVRGHWPCPCGSGRIIRQCHREAIEKLRQVPKEELARSGCLILDGLKERQGSVANLTAPP